MRYLLIILFTALQLSAYPTVYYVQDTSMNANASDSNAGTDIDYPWATWQKAFDTAQPGDTVYFRGGTWRPTSPTFQANITLIDPNNYAGSGSRGYSGTAENHIYYLNYPGEVPIFDCSDIVISGNYAGVISLWAVQFLHFEGLIIQNLYQEIKGRSVQGFSNWMGGNLWVENMTFRNIAGRGMWLGINVGYYGHVADSIGDTWDCGELPCTDTVHYLPYDTIFVTNTDIYDCVDSLSWNPYNYADGIKGDVSVGGSMRLTGVRVWNTCDDGIDLSGPGEKILDHCWVFNIASSIPVEDQDDIDDGNGFKLGGVRDSIEIPNWIMRNCISANNFRYALHELDYTGYYRNNGRAYNNFFYNNDYGPTGFYNTGMLYRNTAFFNNISYNNTTRDVFIYYYEYPESHNTWDFATGDPWYVTTDTVTVTDADFVSLDVELLKASRQSDGSLPNVNFGKLAAGSDLINAGINVGMSAIPDIGIDWAYLGMSTTTGALFDGILNLKGHRVNGPGGKKYKYNGANVRLAEPYTGQPEEPSDTVSPYYISSEVGNYDDTIIVITMSEPLLSDSIPRNTAFSVLAGERTWGIDTIAISGSNVYLSMDTALADTYVDSTITVAYSTSFTALQDTAFNEADSWMAQTVTNNLPAIVSDTLSADLQDDFIFLWTGDTTATGHLRSVINESDYIEVTGKDFTTTIPVTSAATFSIPDNSFLSADAMDGLWYADNESSASVTASNLVSVDFSRTLVRYNDSTYTVEWIGILHPDSIITENKYDQLHEAFDLNVFWSGGYNEYGNFKENRGFNTPLYKGWVSALDSLSMTMPGDSVLEALSRFCVDVSLTGADTIIERMWMFALNDSGLIRNAGTVSIAYPYTSDRVTFPTAMTMTVNGFDGNGTDQYALTNFNPTADGEFYGLNSGSRIVYCYGGSASGAIEGCAGASGGGISMQNNGLNRFHNSSVGASGSYAFNALNRVNSSVVEHYYDSTSGQTSDNAVSMPNESITLLRNTWGYGGSTISFYLVGGAMTSGQVTGIRTAINNYLTRIQ